MRTIDMKRFAQEVALIKTIYNASWEQNWGFIPMTDAEIDHLARIQAGGDPLDHPSSRRTACRSHSASACPT